MIKAVIFDLGSVLAGNEWTIIYKKIADESKIPKKKVEEIVNSLFRKWSLREIDERGFWKGFKNQTGSDVSKKFAKDFFRMSYKKYSKDIKGTWKILSELKSKGIRLAILSNTIAPHVLANKEMGRIRRLRNLGFELFVWSNKERLRKPNPRIFKITLKRLNLPARMCVFVDDKLKNVKVAEKLGMQAIHFKEPGQLRKKLAGLGLL